MSHDRPARRPRSALEGEQGYVAGSVRWGVSTRDRELARAAAKPASFQLAQLACRLWFANARRNGKAE